ncbi:hypothetical protein A3C37_00090 [Candidatus Peribacteria bacterium RIFCSPHIGHO2_02_FULL_53_20]|nr:MAG: hypothetical protein A3C37_00090 [Candidatus Peribacteria bacterium RIFCSPHIGHO2_02_FULL_53_20]OGJ68176.1 MAG: hypothetical protein A3B61_05200 [Candidatus Peribacteria bacterium RIFCSPLOWO2_01_FULL_53_10]OGJ73652.1 MAG: hypothetical protein A3G69_05560 [Candidatus Peribacteria bacterium RIFCSPLOWO2_12_FULL_53_10]
MLLVTAPIDEVAGIDSIAGDGFTGITYAFQMASTGNGIVACIGAAAGKCHTLIVDAFIVLRRITADANVTLVGTRSRKNDAGSIVLCTFCVFATIHNGIAFVATGAIHRDALILVGTFGVIS